jgi:holo-[acyl-carrier protein] synthase
MARRPRVASRRDLLTHQVREMAEGGVVVGVGVDLVDLERFATVLARTPSIVGRMFTPAEQRYAEAKADPTERYAARFAAKEAVMKSLGVGVVHVPLADIEIERDEDSGAPSVQLHRRAAEVAVERGVDRCLVTLTHTDTAAEAVALAFAAAGGGRAP